MIEHIPPYMDFELKLLGVLPVEEEPEQEVRDLDYKPPTFDENGELPF